MAGCLNRDAGQGQQYAVIFFTVCCDLTRIWPRIVAHYAHRKPMYFKVLTVIQPVSVTGGPVLAHCESGMQFRAEVEDREGRRIVRLAGRLERQPSPELVRLCDEAQKPVRLDLTDLLSVDAVGLETLRMLQSRGAELVGASPYLALQLETAQTARSQEQDGSVVPARDARGSRINRASNTEDK